MALTRKSMTTIMSVSSYWHRISRTLRLIRKSAFIKASVSLTDWISISTSTRFLALFCSTNLLWAYRHIKLLCYDLWPADVLDFGNFDSLMQWFNLSLKWLLFIVDLKKLVDTTKLLLSARQLQFITPVHQTMKSDDYQLHHDDGG